MGYGLARIRHGSQKSSIDIGDAASCSHTAVVMRDAPEMGWRSEALCGEVEEETAGNSRVTLQLIPSTSEDGQGASIGSGGHCP